MVNENATADALIFKCRDFSRRSFISKGTSKRIIGLLNSGYAGEEVIGIIDDLLGEIEQERAISDSMRKQLPETDGNETQPRKPRGKNTKPFECSHCRECGEWDPWEGCVFEGKCPCK